MNPKKPILDEPLVDCREAAVRLDTSPKRIYKMCRAGLLPQIRLGRSVRIQPADLRAFVSSNRDACNVPKATGT